jgi:hypothetical protein
MTTRGVTGVARTRILEAADTAPARERIMGRVMTGHGMTGRAAMEEIRLTTAMRTKAAWTEGGLIKPLIRCLHGLAVIMIQTGTDIGMKPAPIVVKARKVISVPMKGYGRTFVTGWENIP